jgi:hypothetical protein
MSRFIEVRTQLAQVAQLLLLAEAESDSYARLRYVGEANFILLVVGQALTTLSLAPNVSGEALRAARLRVRELQDGLRQCLHDTRAWAQEDEPASRVSSGVPPRNATLEPPAEDGPEPREKLASGA